MSGAITITILRMSKLGHREAEEVVQGHTARAFQQRLNPGSLASSPSPLYCNAIDPKGFWASAGAPNMPI